MGTVTEYNGIEGVRRSQTHSNHAPTQDTAQGVEDTRYERTRLQGEMTREEKKQGHSTHPSAPPSPQQQ